MEMLRLQIQRFSHLKDKPTVSYISSIKDWEGMCYVKYQLPSGAGGFDTQAILPCSETEDTITATLIESECKFSKVFESDDKELVCAYNLNNW